MVCAYIHIYKCLLLKTELFTIALDYKSTASNPQEFFDLRAQGCTSRNYKSKPTAQPSFDLKKLKMKSKTIMWEELTHFIQVG